VASAEELARGQREILGFAGRYSYDLGITAGGGIQEGLARWLLLAAEIGVGAGYDKTSALGLRTQTSIFTIDTNAHFVFPRKKYSNFTPYALAGVSVFNIRSAFSVKGQHIMKTSDSIGGFNWGVGSRLALGKTWGLRPEARVSRVEGTHVLRITVAIYKRIKP